MTFRPPQFAFAYSTSTKGRSGDWTDVSEITTSFGDSFQLTVEKKFQRLRLRCLSSAGPEEAVVSCTVDLCSEAGHDEADKLDGNAENEVSPRATNPKESR